MFLETASGIVSTRSYPRAALLFVLIRAVAFRPLSCQTIGLIAMTTEMYSISSERFRLNRDHSSVSD